MDIVLGGEGVEKNNAGYKCKLGGVRKFMDNRKKWKITECTIIVVEVNVMRFPLLSLLLFLFLFFILQ